ncbi:Crp/Fnr family transcriptional regulator [candidate division CSSED10-310 bacterium]|uniref:Crp/Fnr family transcriptional regulator n=1 Tax=candidate division CSSED10-310 bacterium TaxID=2855610 RepID=A0ABV6YSL4_UNCC1
MPDKVKFSRKEIFDYLTPDQMDAVSETSEVIHRKAGEKVYERGKRAIYFFVVLKGKVALSYPIKQDFSVIIDELGPGSMFGSCACLNLEKYNLNAQCLEDSDILRIESGILKKLMDNDLRLGYTIQSKISEIYFLRYITAMKNLKAVVMDVQT